MRLTKIITRRRVMWTSFCATACLAAALIASYWVWPNFAITRSNASDHWMVSFAPGGILVSRNEGPGVAAARPRTGWNFGSRHTQTARLRHAWSSSARWSGPTAWVLDYETTKNPDVLWQRWSVPFWMPMALCAFVTVCLCKTGRVKWMCFALSTALAAAMVLSYWFWPANFTVRANASLAWRTLVSPGELRIEWEPATKWGAKPSVSRWTFDQRESRGSNGKKNQPPITWLPSFNFDTKAGSDPPYVSIPLWAPFVLSTLLTAITFYWFGKPKPGQCRACRYDLAGLESEVCPECGTKIAKTD